MPYNGFNEFGSCITAQGIICEYICTNNELVDVNRVRLGHDSGKLLVSANFDEYRNFEDLAIFRTARRLMEGEVYWE